MILVTGDCDLRQIPNKATVMKQKIALFLYNIQTYALFREDVAQQVFLVKECSPQIYHSDTQHVAMFQARDIFSKAH